MEKFRERRASPRLTIDLPAVVERKGPSGKVTHEQTTLVNLGAQGAYFLSRQRFDPADRICISLGIVPAGADSPGTHLILTGRVLRREPKVAWKLGEGVGRHRSEAGKEKVPYGRRAPERRDLVVPVSLTDASQTLEGKFG